MAGGLRQAGVEFEWDAGKTASNLFKHGVSFGEATTVLSDALEVMIHDPAHSGEEMLPEHDFSHGVRGKHHEAYKAGANVIFLEPDLAKDNISTNRSVKPGAAPE